MESAEKYNYYYKNGNLKLKIIVEKHFNETLSEKLSFPGVLLYNIQKKEGEKFILPYGIWKGYLENGKLEFEVDFNVLKPKSFWSKERDQTIDFDYTACEVRKYDDNERLVSRDYKALQELKSSYLSHENIVEIEDFSAYKLLEEIIEFGDFILPKIQECTSDDLRSKYNLITEQRNWIKGFGVLFDRPEQGALPQYIPFYFEDGEEVLERPGLNFPISYMKSHVEIVTYCEQDALKIINEIMIFNGGVKSFKSYDTEQPMVDIHYRNQLIRIEKGVPKVLNTTLSGSNIELQMVYIGIDLLPPKNITDPFADLNKIRGIHPDSMYINNLLLGLNTPVFCCLDGGIADGRLHVIRDDTSRIILSMDSDFDSTNFRNIIACFSDSNPILNMDDDKMKKILDLSDLLSYENEVGRYNPNINFKKEDSVLSFIIGDKLLISLLKQSGYYQMRIDNVSDEEWKDVTIDKDAQLEFYITKTEESSIESNFDVEVNQLYKDFDKRITDFKNDDLSYWYNIVKDRATSNFSQLDREKPLDQTIAELIHGHAHEYQIRLDGPNGDDYNTGEEYDDNDKIEFIKIRIIAFGTIFKYLSDLKNQINNLLETHQITIDPTQEKMDLELAHAKASLYGAIKYAKSIEITNNNIQEWYPDFIDDHNLIQGQDPMENLMRKFNLSDPEQEDSSNIEEEESNESLDENELLQEKLKTVLENLAKERNKTYYDIKDEKDLKKQEKLFRNAIKEYPDDLEYLNLFAYNQYDQKKFSLGISFAQMAIDRNPEKSAYYDTCAMGYYYKKEYNRALELMTKGIELDPEGERTNILEHYYNRANTYIKLNRINDAKKDFQKVISLEQFCKKEDGNYEVYNNLKTMAENELKSLE